MTIKSLVMDSEINPVLEQQQPRKSWPHSSSRVNPDDSSFFFNCDILGEGKIAQRRGLPLARTQHPLQKAGECIPCGVVRTPQRNNNPGKGTDRISVCTRSIHDGHFEVPTESHGAAPSGGGVFPPG